MDTKHLILTRYELVWLEVWRTIAGREHITYEAPTIWADRCLAEFEERFGKREVIARTTTV